VAFEGQNAGEIYSQYSLQSVLKQALQKSKITKPVTLHYCAIAMPHIY
jgi:integrase/recombinase XerD